MRRTPILTLTAITLALGAAVRNPTQAAITPPVRRPAAEACNQVFSEPSQYQVKISGPRMSHVELTNLETGELEASGVSNRLPPVQRLPIHQAFVTKDGKGMIFTQFTGRAELTVSFWKLGSHDAPALLLNSLTIDYHHDKETPQIVVDELTGRVEVKRVTATD